MALSRKDSKAALDLLQPLQRFELRYGDVTLARAKAQLVAGDIAAAIAEFKRIVDAPPAGPAGTVYPVALIGLARARAATGDTAGAKAAYDRASARPEGCRRFNTRPNFRVLQCVLPSGGGCWVFANTRASIAGVSTVGGCPRYRPRSPSSRSARKRRRHRLM